MFEAIIKEQFGIEVLRENGFGGGAGSELWLLETNVGRLLLKFPEENSMNHPELEPPLCDFLWKQGIPVCSFLPAKDGGWLGRDARGRRCTLQRWFDGTACSQNAMPEPLLYASALLLGRIHKALRDYPALPEGIGAGFFQHMTPQRAAASYQETVRLARERGEAAAAADAQKRLALLERLPELRFDLAALTLRSTHGDYRVQQLLCGRDGIRVVLDWTSACVHPAVWELLRSFSYGDPSLAAGSKAAYFDLPRLRRYVDAYRVCGTLSDDDLEAMPDLLLYQLAVCDYDRQYLDSAASSRALVLEQAQFSTRLIEALLREREAMKRALLAR